MKPVKVCCFCEKWESGGIESFLYNVFLSMDMTTVQVDIVAAELSESVFTQLLREHGIRFVELSGQQQRLLTNHRIFRNLLRKEKYDVVHLNIFHGLSLYYAYLAKQEHVPIRVAHSHNTALRQSRTRALKQLVHRMARELFTGSATDLWACSETAANFLFSKRSLKNAGFRFIPNGIDTERFRFDFAVRESVRRELGVEGQFLIGNVGRLCYQKNQAFLLDIFAAVLRLRPEGRLLLIGEGEAEAALLQEAERLGVANAVIFYGTSAHVERLLWAMDVFVFPSHFEGLGIAAIEAQAAGLPVVASENVPEEACVTDSFQTVPLGAGEKKWAQALMERQDCAINREAGAAIVQEAGFDIRTVAERIRKMWMG